MKQTKIGNSCLGHLLLPFLWCCELILARIQGEALLDHQEHNILYPLTYVLFLGLLSINQLFYHHHVHLLNGLQGVDELEHIWMTHASLLPRSFLPLLYLQGRNGWGEELVRRTGDRPKGKSREGRMSQRGNVPRGKCRKGKVTLRLYDLNVEWL